ncbi:MAG: YggS family pyridoxal phosphate-dependent enzyme [Clostridia bacterium]|nr:YggS family pyridoxal phosphate-dependent enzyme [Clostridia bacterium]
MDNYGYIKENFDALSLEIAEYGKRYGRRITLVSVTKSGTDEELVALCRAGASDIGENRPGELARRGVLLREAGLTPTLHEIGNLQRNKVKLIIENVALIHSLDSLSLAEEINKQAAKCGRRVPVLIEINSGREENKGGILPECAEEFFLKVRELPSLSVAGLMTMGSVCTEPEDSRKYFRLTYELYRELSEKYGFEGEGILSMGMSDSYKVAIEEGSTLVRVGRRLFRHD